MNIAEFTIKKTVLSVIVIFVTLFGGWHAYQNMARFEDPEFTIREAVVVTHYPGASPHQVALEITEPLEKAIQQLAEVKSIKSVSTAGKSEITVEVKYESSKTRSDLQLVWNKLRNKVSDAERSLPPGADKPYVADDFGDVFGLLFFLTGEGYSNAELKQYADTLQNTLLKVDGVARVTIEGAKQEVIYVEISRSDIKRLGASFDYVLNVLSQQNAVASAGSVTAGSKRLVISPTEAIDSVDAIANLLVTVEPNGKLIYLKDIANVYQGYKEPDEKLYRYDGEPALAIGISGVLGSNIVKIGADVDKAIEDSLNLRPVGMELHEFYHQANIVDASVQNFVANVIAALVIVIVTLLIFMGFKSALVIGAILVLTIGATLATMNYVAIPMHRISLGALIIALGMMVDNAIVVTEGILVGLKRGASKLDIAKETVQRSIWPLLGGTLVGIIAFAPIGFAPGSTAEYTGHLFWVILIALLYSWLFAITLTPLFCYWLFKENTMAQDDNADTEGRVSKGYKTLLAFSLKKRIQVIACVFGLFALSLWGFQFVKPGFFPASTTPLFVVDYWQPQGTDIKVTEADIDELNNFVASLEGVENVQATVGGGAPRFMLVYGPQSPNSSYGQLLVKTQNDKQIDPLLPQIQAYIDTNFPDALGKVWKFTLGPGGGSKIEAKFSGPEPEVLRRLSEEAKKILLDDGKALSVKDNWRQPVPVFEPIYAEKAAQRIGVSREDLASALERNFSGQSIGAYRQDDELIPIVIRATEDERASVSDIRNVNVVSSITGESVPIDQVTDGYRTVWKDGLVRRVDRNWELVVQADPVAGEYATDLFNRIRPQIEAIDLPDGYVLEWGGEYGDSKESNENLASTIPLGFLAMVIVVLVLFGTVRQPLVIWLVVPLALVGVVAGLLVTQTPMEFMAILGLLSLSGLLIKNAIVLVDQIDLEISGGKQAYDAVLEASASRVRPVMMGALTTVLGVIPLYFDAFFKSMSVVLVFGLTFATLLTLIIVPVLYSVLFRIKPPTAE
ncbi:efflux RND transporter permease subunit [Enterovibrio sp. ZSDZ35]|uniref:Efflux RND transporter permease subunit n=1 Tax=Enterovibrio qingdaonensis TaxID=2899818 RepID=A0ABT5QQ66_9GAMM|nr:efflux RND transporter permease subunit [Enterovibrio sp. ZSDZ35]MDD1783122.1 efflux RND transporter permease subunit [Enterovibrio sp. ZSDZ35]